LTAWYARAAPLPTAEMKGSSRPRGSKAKCGPLAAALCVQLSHETWWYAHGLSLVGVPLWLCPLHGLFAHWVIDVYFLVTAFLLIICLCNFTKVRFFLWIITAVCLLIGGTFSHPNCSLWIGLRECFGRSVFF
jgi:hypothetical protein